MPTQCRKAGFPAESAGSAAGLIRARRIHVDWRLHSSAFQFQANLFKVCRNTGAVKAKQITRVSISWHVVAFFNMDVAVKANVNVCYHGS